MADNIEVELRGPLTKEAYLKLKKFFDKKAKLLSSEERIFIDYSTLMKSQGIRHRDIDIRIRSTNKIPEIMIKLGHWGDNRERKELSIKGKQGNFDTFVQVFAALGVTRGMIVKTRRTIYDYKNVEFALVNVADHSYIFEAEKLLSKNSNIKKARAEIEKVLKELGLRVFTNDEFYKHIETIKNEAAELFDFKNYKENYFKKRYGL